jgi:hypothetical protein
MTIICSDFEYMCFRVGVRIDVLATCHCVPVRAMITLQPLFTVRILTVKSHVAFTVYSISVVALGAARCAALQSLFRVKAGMM